MDWKKMISEVMAAGKTQAYIATAIGVKQPTISGLLSGDQKDMRWQNGERLRSLHAAVMAEAQANEPTNA